MASFCVHVFALALLASFCNSVHSSALNKHHVALFVFGDSICEAGNNNYINTTNDFRTNFRPYGETSFPNATANFAKKQFVQPYLAIKNRLNDRFINGVNFASAGAGSLDGTNAGLGLSELELDNFKIGSKDVLLTMGEDEANLTNETNLKHEANHMNETNPRSEDEVDQANEDQSTHASQTPSIINI
nr:GDSL esterase/lipase 1-like [Ipomoea trifida]